MKNPLYTSQQGCTNMKRNKVQNMFLSGIYAEHCRSKEGLGKVCEAGRVFFLVLCLMMTTLGAWGQVANGNYLLRIDVNGGEYYMAYGKSDQYAPNAIFASAEAQEWTIKKETNGYYSIKRDGNGYLYYTKNNHNVSFNNSLTSQGNGTTYYSLNTTGTENQYYIVPSNDTSYGLMVNGVGNSNNPLLGTNYYNGQAAAQWTFLPALQPEEIIVDPTDVTLDLNDEATLTVELAPDGCYNDVRFVSNDPSVATVDENGVIKGVAYGSTTITVTAKGSDGTDKCTETVNVTVRKIETGQYVIYYKGNGDHFLGGVNTNDITTFNPATCLWTGGDAAKWQNGNGNYLFYEETYTTVNLGTRRNYTQNLRVGNTNNQSFVLNGGKLYRNANDYCNGALGIFINPTKANWYVRFNGTSWEASKTDSQDEVVYPVTKYSYDEILEEPTIEGDNEFGKLESKTYTTDPQYRQGYINYVFDNKDHFFLRTDNSDIIGTTPTDAEPKEANFSYTWSLAGDMTDNGHVRIDPATGKVTYYNYYNTDTPIEISVVASSTIKTFPKVSKTVTFQYQRVSPTAISTDGNKTLYIGENHTINVTLTPANAYRKLTFTSNDTNIASVDIDGNVTANAVGTATITVQAETMEGTTPDNLKAELTITVKDIVATPEISFQPDGLSALTTLTTTTTGASIYYTIDGEDPTSASTLYSAPFSVNNLQTVRAIAVMTGANARYYDNSDVASATYSAQKVPKPIINVRGYEVTFSCYESEVTYYYTYTTDGTEPADPTTSSTQWNGNTINGAQNMKIKVFATKTGLAPSDVASTTLKKANIVYLDLNNGNDRNDGLTKEKPKKTWGAAYGLLGYGPNARYLRQNWSNTLKAYVSENSDFNNTVDNNIIYLVGDVSADQINDLLGYTNNKSNTTGTSYTTSQSRVLAAGVMKPATISGKYATNGEVQITFPTDSYSTLNEDTRFEHINFRASANGAFLQIMCAYYDLEMGEGVRMSNMLSTANYTAFDTGCAPGTDVPHFQIYGGLENDCRFGQNANSELNFDKYLPHPEGFKIVLRSGFYSTICAGGKKWGVDGINGMMGSPNTPIKCTILVDINHAYNESVATPLSVGRTPNYDVGAILAGNHEGAMFGDVDIVIKSGRIGRVVNGTLGANRAIGNYPMDSFFGRANILVDPRSPLTGEETKYPTKNDMVQIKDLYGGSLGRCTDGSTQVKAYFYGKSSVTINGGTFLSALYAGGAGGVNGIGENNRHTNDEKLPYKTGNNINYGTYAQYVAGTKLPVTCHLSRSVNSPDFHEDDNSLDETIDLSDTKAEITIRGGVFGSSSSRIDGIFGGGYGFANEALVNYTDNTIIPHTQAGSLFGKTGSTASKVTIKGGTIWGNVYGAGCGTDTYYTSSRNDKGNYTTLGIINGNVELIIDSVAVINGSVYGAGKGVENASLPNMARLYGNTTLTIGGSATITGNVYGGGADGATEGNTSLALQGNMRLYDGSSYGDAFGGGYGAKAVVTGNTTVNKTGGTVLNVYGGGSQADTKGSTTVTIDGSTVNQNVFGGGKSANVDVTTNVTVQGTSAIGGSVFGGCDITGNVGMSDGHRGRLNIDNPGSVGYAKVQVLGGTVAERVFGGGNGLNYGTVSSSPTSGSYASGTDVYTYTNGTYSGKALPQVENSWVIAQNCTIGTTPGSGTHTIFGGGQGAGTRVVHNVDLQIGNTTQNTTINGISYGGSLSGFVNSDCDDHTTTTILGYGSNTQIKGDIYGGSYGNFVRGEIFVDVNNVQIGVDDAEAGIFAGNNEAAQPECNATINYVGNDCNVTLYGGGNRSDFYGTTRITFTTGKVGYIFGGGNNADVYGNTIVEILGGEVCHSVYGGGKNGNVKVWETSQAHPIPGGVARYGGNTLVIVRDDCLQVSGSDFVADALTGNRSANRSTSSDTYFGSADPYATAKLMYVLQPNDASKPKRSTIKIGENVFGGGLNGQVEGNANVQIGANRE